MVRIDVDYPNNKVVCLLAEYKEFLTMNWLMDVWEVNRQNHSKEVNDQEEVEE